MSTCSHQVEAVVFWILQALLKFLRNWEPFCVICSLRNNTDNECARSDQPTFTTVFMATGILVQLVGSITVMSPALYAPNLKPTVLSAIVCTRSKSLFMTQNFKKIKIKKWRSEKNKKTVQTFSKRARSDGEFTLVTVVRQHRLQIATKQNQNVQPPDAAQKLVFLFFCKIFLLSLQNAFFTGTFDPRTVFCVKWNVIHSPILWLEEVYKQVHRCFLWKTKFEPRRWNVFAEQCLSSFKIATLPHLCSFNQLW